MGTMTAGSCSLVRTDISTPGPAMAAAPAIHSRTGKTAAPGWPRFCASTSILGSPYAIPPSNPFGTEVWAYGLRNPWRFSFDHLTGDLWIADVGQGAWEEVDFQPATSIGGENYGWHLMEGNHCFRPSSNCNDGTLVLPIAEYNHSNGACSITGGYRYRGARFPRLQGLYLYGDYCAGGIWAVMQQGGGWTVRQLLSKKMAISTFGEDFNGELYVADYANGIIDQIIDELPPPSRRRAAAHR